MCSCKRTGDHVDSLQSVETTDVRYSKENGVIIGCSNTPEEHTRLSYGTIAYNNTFDILGGGVERRCARCIFAASLEARCCHSV